MKTTYEKSLEQKDINLVIGERNQIRDDIYSQLRYFEAFPRSRAYSIAKGVPELHVFYWSLNNSYYVLGSEVFKQLKGWRARFTMLNDFLREKLSPEVFDSITR